MTTPASTTPAPGTQAIRTLSPGGGACGSLGVQLPTLSATPGRGSLATIPPGCSLEAERECQHCSGPLNPRRAARGDVRYCNERPCQLAYMRDYSRRWLQTDAGKAARSAKKQRRRARLAGVPHERWDRYEVAERDGWACWLCGTSIPPEAHYPEPASLSTDHLVPISRGGDDTPANVAAAHLSCNVRRGDRLDVTTLPPPDMVEPHD